MDRGNPRRLHAAGAQEESMTAVCGGRAKDRNRTAFFWAALHWAPWQNLPVGRLAPQVPDRRRGWLHKCPWPHVIDAEVLDDGANVIDRCDPDVGAVVRLQQRHVAAGRADSRARAKVRPGQSTTDTGSKQVPERQRNAMPTIAIVCIRQSVLKSLAGPSTWQTTG